MGSESGSRAFSPVRHITGSEQWRTLSLAARLLALVIANRLRRTLDGRYVIWRGRKSLAEIAGLSTKTVTRARRELLGKGLFLARRGGGIITAADGRAFNVAKGVIVLELVLDVPAFVEGRAAARDANARRIEQLTHADRLSVQKAHFRGEIDRAEMEARENAIRQTAIRERWQGEQIPPSDLPRRS